MKPKEKAQELFDRFDDAIYGVCSDVDAKECALVCVQEMLNQFMGGGSLWQYWKEVKQEIEKL